MTTYYRILRRVEQADLDAEPLFAKTLESIPPEGRVTFDELKRVGKGRTRKAIAYACSCGILERILPCEEIMKLDSVKFLYTQINRSGFKNTKESYSTRELYMRMLYRFNFWMQGRLFQSYKTVVAEGQVARRAVKKSFADLEELMNYCNESEHGTKTAQRVIREYLAALQEEKATNNTRKTARSAIKAYFKVHDIELSVPTPKDRRSETTPVYEALMEVIDVYKMLENGNPSITMRTIIMIKFQSGMDSSTLADRFNREGYEQMVKHFKTDDHSRWNLDLCPVPIMLGRVKTDVKYTTFLDRDAITQLQEFLTWKEAKHGKHDPSKPLFLTKYSEPIRSTWVSTNFSRIAVRAGIQEKISHKLYRVRAHELRDLLKSTLLAAGCITWAADHVIGHAPRDSYEKQHLLYPEELRAEYAKASSRLNIFSKISSTLNSPDDPDSLKKRLGELEEIIAKSEMSKAEVMLIERRHQKTIKIMEEVIEELKREIEELKKLLQQKGRLGPEGGGSTPGQEDSTRQQS